MSDTDDPLDQRLLDRMVDGELTDEEQQAVLRRLEDTSDCAGWRRLALAFVEDQFFRRSLQSHAVQHESHVPLPEPAKAGSAATGRSTEVLAPALQTPSPGSRSAQVRRSLTVVSLVPLLLASFWLGRLSIFSWSDDVTNSDGAPTIAQDGSQDSVSESPASSDRNDWPTTAGTGTGDDYIAESSAAPPTTVRVVYGDDWRTKPQIVDVPLSTDVDLEALLNDSRPLFSQELRESLERTGQRLEESRDLWSVDLPDGRQAVIPVRQVRVNNVSTIFP
ncbi:MAG: hypothetical protein ACYTGL_27790 [Planctomycetota bacterium]|jgi:hypothetical protein